jgi:taurine dioxygenase
MTAPSIKPLSDQLPFGARVTGVTATDFSDPSWCCEINALFEQRGMIVFEGMEPSSQMQVALSNVFGPLKDHPVKIVARVDQSMFPGVIEIANRPDSGIVEINGEPLVNWQPWHFDHSYNNELNRAGVLRAVTLPPEGGLTGFADGIQIYNSLSPSIRDKIEGREIVYTLDLLYTNQRFGLPKGFREIRPKSAAILEAAKAMPRAIHPAVWVRKSGEKVMHMSPYGAAGFHGDETPEGAALFREAWAEIERVAQPYFHRWKQGDMVIWDNWRMLHQARGVNPKFPRVMHRTTIKGDYGLGYFEDKSSTAKAPLEMM